MKTLVLGGVKSGKSRYAENRLKTCIRQQAFTEQQVVLVVTGQALDQAMAERISQHQQQRPAGWRVIEAPIHLADAIETAQENAELIMVDCLTLWLTNLLMLENRDQLQAELDRLIDVVERCQDTLILVSNETNMGIMPLGQLTRDYCDYIGVLHQRLAELADEVVLVVAGLPLFLKSAASPCQGDS
jgi:adenosylcobinamide kinase/adenosylcobinamide-phosphate guanylyltransferase